MYTYTYIYTYDVHVWVNHPNLCIFFTSAPLFDRPLLLLRTWFSNCIYAWGHRCDPGSCANEHGQMSQWYQRETSLSRTCSVLSILFWSSWHGAQPRTSSPIFPFLHGFRNLLELLRPTWYSQSFGCGKSTGSGDGNSANTFGFSLRSWRGKGRPPILLTFNWSHVESGIYDVHILALPGSPILSGLYEVFFARQMHSTT
jgi:hypothetical protein